MNIRRIHAEWALPLLLILLQFWLAGPVHGQGVTLRDDDPAANVASAANARLDPAASIATTAPGSQDPAPAADAQASPATSPDSTETVSPESNLFGGPTSTEDPSTYYREFAQPVTLGEPDFGLVRQMPGSEQGVPEYGVPYSSVFSLTGADGESIDPLAARAMFLNMNQTPEIGGADGSIAVGTGAAELPAVPFIYRAFPPEDADLKAGPFYLKINRLDADMFYSDNYKLSAHDRQSEVLALIALNMTLTAQISDDLQFALNGTIFYLPLQNQVGFVPPNLASDLGFLVGAIPLLSTQIVQDTNIGGWDVRFADQFRTNTGGFSDSTRDSWDTLNNAGLQQVDGHYVFHSGHVSLRGNSSSTSTSSQSQDFFTVYSNTLSAVTSNYVPDDILFTARALRTDLWYNQGSRGLPTSRDNLSLLAESVRPNMRFKPYVGYDINHSSDVPGVFQTIHFGIFGPITDQLFLRAEAGYFFSNTGHEDALWTLSLEHDAGENTSEYVNVTRGLNYFDDEVITTESYQIKQILGPNISATAFADHADYQELSDPDLANRSQDDAGASLTWILGPKTTLALLGNFSHQDFTDGYVTTTWTGSVDLSREVSDTIYFRAFYQYQRYNPNEIDRGYYEDLVFLSLTKYFP